MGAKASEIKARLGQINKEIDAAKSWQRREYDKKRREYLRLRKELARGEHIPDKVIERARDDFDFFSSAFLWTYDPRINDPEIRHQPFILYPFQEEAAARIIDHINGKRDILIEKSRDMGATWLILGIFLWGFLFHEWHLKLGSRKDDVVDKYGDMDTLFERLRYMVGQLHAGLGFYFDEKRHYREKLIKHPYGTNAITGEATTKTFSRSGRFNAILLDEFAFVEPEDSEAIWQACGDSTPCRIALSTPPVHMRGKFVNLRMSGNIDVITLHWTLHPFKDTEWYEREKRRRSTKEVAIELDIDYTASSDDRIITMNDIRQSNSKVTDIDPATYRILSIDLARFGEDYTVVKVGWKNKKGQVYVAKTYKLKHRKGTEVLGFINAIKQDGDTVVIDAIGMGESFSDFLEQSVSNMLPFRGSEASNNPNLLNLRSEAYFLAAEMFRKGLLRDDDETTMQQMTMLWYDYSSTGKKMVVSKEKMRRYGVKSPDHADSLVMLAWAAQFIDVVVEDTLNTFWKRELRSIGLRMREDKWEEFSEEDFEDVLPYKM